MNDKSSFLSILILLVFFIVVPSVMKFLGRYTMSAKNADKPADPEHQAAPEEHMPEPMEGSYRAQDYETQRLDLPPDKPIHPKWF